MMILENGIGSNYHTLNNNPISHFHDERIRVEMYPSAWGKVSVSVTCDLLDFDSGVKQFDTEAAAKLYATNITSKLTTTLDSKLVENVIKRILSYSGK